VRKRVGHSAQLLNGIDEDEAMAFLSDRRMIAQQKLDGNRVLVHVDEESFATNRAGQVATIHASIFEGLSQLPRGTVVDGEVVGGADGPVYWLFDVLFVGTEDLRAHGYLARWDRLDGDIEPGVSGPVQVLECAHDPAAKRSLYERLRAARAEGIVFKDKDAPYKPGRPASGGAHFKHKFVKTADVVLTENVGNAYRMTVYDGKKVCQIGKVFSGTTNDSRQEIDRRLSEGEKLVAEVRYLYATADDQLFQPVFVRLRSDKKPTECFLSQLEKTSRDVHDV
jgi:ATP-dependent DNA ligase